MAVAQLGSLKWRVDPSNVSWNYQIDANRIETLGGQVVQILGSTLSDLTVSGDLGQDHGRAQESWQLANAFHQNIKAMMDWQTLPAKQSNFSPMKNGKPKSFTDAGVVHRPFSFTYMDGVHNWSFQVLIKGISDADGSGSITYSNGKFNHAYILSLFIVQADSELVRTIASDAFISRISAGIGWKQSAFNGPMNALDAQTFIESNGGSISGLLAAALSGQPLQQPNANNTPSFNTRAPGRVKAQ